MGDQFEYFEVEFPPNDPMYLPEIDRLLTFTKDLLVWARVHVTGVLLGHVSYSGELHILNVYGVIRT